MNARITEQTPVRATVEVTVSAVDVDATFERVITALARKAKIPGFRPGKAPRGVLLQRIGAEALAEDVRDAIVDEHYPKAMVHLGLKPIHAHSHAEPPAPGSEWTFQVHADLFPEFELPNVDGIVLETPVTDVSEDDVARTIERLRDDHVTLIPVERAVEAGDVVFLDMNPSDDNESSGGAGMPVDLDRTESAIVEQLLGKNLGDRFDLDLGDDPNRAPEEAGEGPVRRSLPVRLADIKAKERPEVNDAFAATLGFPDWAAVDAELRRGLAIEQARETFNKQRDELIEKLVSAVDVPLPAILVRRRQGHLLEDLGNDLKRRGLTMEQYLGRLEERGEREKFEAELLQSAERSVKRDLVLEELVNAHGAPISDAEVNAAIRQVALRERKDPERFKRDQGAEWLANFKYLMQRDKTLEALVQAKAPQAPEAAEATQAPAATESSAG
jgi:trigger factor